MQRIDREGSFRGKILEGSVGLTQSGDLPQAVLSLSVAEYYDPETKEWEDWNEYDMGTTAYLCLFGKQDQVLKNAEQLAKIVNWDGTSFTDLEELLNAEDGVDIQFRVQESTYQDKTRLKVEWVDLFDAEPGGVGGPLKHMDKKELSALDKKFGKSLKSMSGGKVKTAKAPPKSKAKTDDAKDEKKDTKKKSPPPAPTSKKKKAKELTLETAWQEVCAKTDDIDDEERQDSWMRITAEVAPDTEVEDITSEQWGAIAEYVVKDLTSD